MKSVPIELPIVWVILLNVFGWPVIQLGLAWLFTRLPAEWFPASAGTSLRSRGRFYERYLGVKRWKDRLPDGASWFIGGFAKSHLASADSGHLQRFVRETWRGEVCHWVTLAFTPVFFLWNPLWADIVMAAYGIASNLPCIIAQRYNRIRLLRLVGRIPVRNRSRP